MHAGLAASVGKSQAAALENTVASGQDFVGESLTGLSAIRSDTCWHEYDATRARMPLSSLNSVTFPVRPPRPVRVVLADDECMFRASLRQLLAVPPPVINDV